MTLITDEKTWEKEGVRITYLLFSTIFSLNVENVLREKYLVPDPTPEDPNQGIVPVEVFMFYRAMPLILAVELADTAPLWGKKLKQEIESPDWLSNPVADFIRIERRMPDDLLLKCYEGYKATREKALAAPLILQGGEPQKPRPDPETGVIDPETENFTESDTANGGTPSNVKVLPEREKPSSALRRKAK